VLIRGAREGEALVPREFFWLTLTIAMTGLFWVPYIIDRIQVRGRYAAVDNPKPTDTPQSPWAQRAMSAHANAVENLVIFAPLVLVAHALNISNGVTVGACIVYFWARLAHFVVYTMGIPVGRTVAFTIGFFAQAALVLAIFQFV
jgi:uncharacterized MAPEG superfamily protein